MLTPEYDKTTNDRMPPQNIDAERALLGAILIDPKTYSKSMRYLSSMKDECFYVPAHQYIFNAMGKLSNARKPFDAITLQDQLESDGTLEDAGGLPYLTDLTGAVPTSANSEHYASIVQLNARKRKMITLLSQSIGEIYDSESDPDNVSGSVRRGLIACEPSNRRGMVKVGDVVEEVVEELGTYVDPDYERSDITTGIGVIDDLIVNPKSDSVMVMAARTSIGKSAVALNVAKNVSMGQGKPVLFFSLEMSVQACMERLMQMSGEVNIHAYKRERKNNALITEIAAAGMKLSNIPLWLNDTPRIDLDEMIAVIRLHIEKIGKPALIVIDYLQLISLGEANHRGIDVRQRIMIITGALKEMAKEFNTPLLCLSQLSRIAGDKPELIHLAESGSIENDADYVVLISRSTADPKISATKLLMDLAKNRHGPIGSGHVLFIQSHQLVRDMKKHGYIKQEKPKEVEDEQEDEQGFLY
jgi:replicative DNA helicase